MIGVKNDGKRDINCCFDWNGGEDDNAGSINTNGSESGHAP